MWLKESNLLYSDVKINHELLNNLEESQILPFHIEHIISNDAVDIFLASCYKSYNDVDQLKQDSQKLRSLQSPPNSILWTSAKSIHILVGESTGVQSTQAHIWK